MNALTQKIEAVLFIYGEPMEPARLAKLIGANPEEISTALLALADYYAEEGRGITLAENNGKVQLTTKPETASLIEALIKEEVTKTLTPAAVETLALIVYLAPIHRSEIDYIRGVNSTFILRSLLMRGLVERAPDPAHPHLFLYTPSIDLLKHLGLTKREDLPEYETYSRFLERFKAEGSASHEGTQ